MAQRSKSCHEKAEKPARALDNFRHEISHLSLLNLLFGLALCPVVFRVRDIVLQSPNGFVKKGNAKQSKKQEIARERKYFSIHRSYLR